VRLRVLDLPFADDSSTSRFALVVDQADMAALPESERVALHAFGERIGAAGVLISEHDIAIGSMTPLIELRHEPGLSTRLAGLRDAIARSLPPAVGKRLI
jgi:hypothetical protein